LDKRIKKKLSLNITKKYLGHQKRIFSLVETVNQDISQLSNEENAILIVDFSEQEIHDVIMQMKTNKGPGPDRFPTEFYKKNWDILKGDLLDMFASFQKGELPICQ
jgi:hypothetical protein